MGFFRSTKGSIISDSFHALDDIAQIKAGLMVDVALYSDHLGLTVPFISKEPITLNYSQITDVFYGLETEIVEKDKSPIGRAIVGGLLFGKAGAVVGAVSGTGTKKKKERHFLFIISYISSQGEEKFLKFEDTRLYKGRKVAMKLKELCGISSESKKVTSL